MRPLAHVIGVLLLLPVMTLAAAFLVLGRAIRAGSLTDFLGELLAVALWLIPWGLLALTALLLTLMAAGFSLHFRWLAGLCLALLAIGSSAVVLALSAGHGNFAAAQLLFFVPGLLAAAIGVWHAASEWPRGGGIRRARS